jgi:hypothetical protein
LVTVLALAAAAGVPPGPAFTFVTQLMAALFAEHRLLFWPTLIGVLLLAAASVQSVAHSPGRSARGSSDQPRLVLTALLLILGLGIVTLAFPSLIQDFIKPIIAAPPDRLVWWSFAIALAAVAGGIGLGYALRTRAVRPASAADRSFEIWIRRTLGSAPHRALTAAGTFIVQVVEPRAANWTFGALATLYRRRPANKDKPPGPPTFSLLTFLLGVASLIAFLLLQGGQGQ